MPRPAVTDPPGELMKSLMSCFVFFFVVVLVEVVVIGEREVGGGSECLKKKKERHKRDVCKRNICSYSKKRMRRQRREIQ